MGGFCLILKKNKKIVLIDEGIYVISKYRGKSISSLLWKFAIKTFKVQKIKVITMNVYAENFIIKLKEEYPDIDWDILAR